MNARYRRAAAKLIESMRGWRHEVVEWLTDEANRELLRTEGALWSGEASWAYDGGRCRHAHGIAFLHQGFQPVCAPHVAPAFSCRPQ